MKTEKEENTLYEPPYPTPLQSKDKRSLYKLYKRGKESFIHTFFEGSYSKDTSVNNISGIKIFMPKRPEDVKNVLKKDFKHFPKDRFIHNILKPLLGDSIFTTNGETWEKQRRIIDIGFEKAGLRNVYKLMVDAVDDMHVRIERDRKTGPIQIQEEMTHVTADIIMRTILSRPIKTDKAMKVFHYFVDYQEKSTSLNILHTFRIPKWVSIYTYVRWKIKGKQIRSILGKIISERYQEFVEKEGKTEYGDILEAIMGTEDPVTKEKFSRKELTDQIVMLFLAGHETSASALSWSLYILANQPKHADSLTEEAEKIWPEQEIPDFSQIHKLKKARGVFRETLRLYPPVFLFSRESTGKCPVGNLKTSVKDVVSICPWLIHRREELWKDPHAFKPERFEEGENKANQGAYIPFSMGPRVCLGAAFAQQEALLILSTIAKKYHLSSVEGAVPEPIGRLTLRSKNGIYVNFAKR